MVLIFQHPKPLEFLARNGYVYTFRTRLHKEGKDWVTDRRGGRKLFDCLILKVEEYNYNGGDPVRSLRDFLEPFVHSSGFDRPSEWVLAVMLLNRGKYPRRGVLYHVRRL